MLQSKRPRQRLHHSPWRRLLERRRRSAPLQRAGCASCKLAQPKELVRGEVCTFVKGWCERREEYAMRHTRTSNFNIYMICILSSSLFVSLIIFLLVTLASGYLRPGTLTSSNIVCILRLVLCILRARILYYTIIYNNMHYEDHGTQVFLE